MYEIYELVKRLTEVVFVAVCGYAIYIGLKERKRQKSKLKEQEEDKSKKEQ